MKKYLFYNLLKIFFVLIVSRGIILSQQRKQLQQLQKHSRLFRLIDRCLFFMIELVYISYT